MALCKLPSLPLPKLVIPLPIPALPALPQLPRLPSQPGCNELAGTAKEAS